MKFTLRQLIVPLLAALALTTNSAMAGPKVDVNFVLPSNITWYTAQALKITDVASGEVQTHHDVKSTGSYTFRVQSGFGPKLYKFEWKAGVGGHDALQVIYQWIDVPSGLDQEHVVPLHVVTFERDANKVSGVKVAALGSRHIERAQLGTKQNKWVDPLHDIASFDYWKYEREAVIMTGCYSFFTYSGDRGNSRKYNHADSMTCVASDMTIMVQNP